MKIAKIKVTEKDIENLDQLDRIEYKFEKDKLERSSGFFYLTYKTFWVMAFLVFIVALFKSLGFTAIEHTEFYLFMAIILELVAKIFFIAFICDIVLLFVNKKRENDLDVKYFGKFYNKEVKK